MKANIVIFGKNSIIAQNFINKDYLKISNFINISRYSSDTIHDLRKDEISITSQLV